VRLILNAWRLGIDWLGSEKYFVITSNFIILGLIVTRFHCLELHTVIIIYVWRRSRKADGIFCILRSFFRTFLFRCLFSFFYSCKFLHVSTDAVFYTRISSYSSTITIINQYCLSRTMKSTMKSSGLYVHCRAIHILVIHTAVNTQWIHSA
jgi:hypothetical protein